MRVPSGEPFAWSRSVCPHCRTTLQARDLWPVLSYLFTMGKCRYCGTRISGQYVLVELSTAFLFVLAYFRYQFTLDTMLALLVLSLVMIVTITDLRYMRIPNAILLFFASCLLLIRIFVAPYDPWWDPFLAALLSFSVLYGVMIMSGGGLGGGDVKLFAVLGLAFGLWDLLLVFFLSTLFGTLSSLAAFASGHLKRGQAFPFAPSIALAGIVVLFIGDWLWGLYPVM